jgi:hypothetical protein
MLAISGTEGSLHVFTGPSFANRKVFQNIGRVVRAAYSPDGSMIAVSVWDSSRMNLRIYDSSMSRLLYTTASGDYVQRFSPTSRYLLTTNDILDVRTWKSVYMSGGDYNNDVQHSAFIDNDRFFIRSTKDFGIYELNLTEKTKSRYINYRGKAFFSEDGRYAWVLDSTEKLSCIRTGDWTLLSSINIPYRLTNQNVNFYGHVFPHPTACAVGFKNSLGTLYLWYPLSSTVTAVSEESGDTVESVCGIAQALSIRCRNGSAQLVLNGEPDSHSIRVVDVLGRDVAFEMDNRTVRLSNCRPGYHLVRYHHNGRTVSIPLMVVEE